MYPALAEQLAEAFAAGLVVVVVAVVAFVGVGFLGFLFVVVLVGGLGVAASLGLQASIESPDLADDLVSKADAQVRALTAQVDDPEALPEDLQDVEEPAAASTDDQPDTEDDADDVDEESEAEADEATDDDDDDEDAGDALGAMF